MLITFEGIDGCGKSTQINKVIDYLKENNKEVISLREPGGTELSETIREILLYSKTNITAVSELMLFNAARADLVSKVIIPALKKNIFVICDRFYDSTTAYQGYGRGMSIDIIHEFNMLATGGIKPDLTFYLDIPIEISHLRTSHKRLDRMEKSGDEFFNRVIDGFRNIQANEPERVFLVDSSGTIDQTFAEIKKVISKYL